MSKIIGNTVGTTMLRPDWAETDKKSSAYIGNKPTAADGNFLVGNDKGNLKEMTPDEVLSHINGASVKTLTTEEFEALENSEINANTLYLLTDDEDTSVKYTEQSLTYEQKAQARSNIGIDIATDDEIIDLLVQEDMLPAIADSDGSILSDEDGNILSW